MSETQNLKLTHGLEEECRAIQALPPLFYIISYKHSSGGVLTFWRSNDAGYTTDLRKAGMYTEAQVREKFNYYNYEYEGEIYNKAVLVTDIFKYYDTRLIVEPNTAQRKKHLKMIRLGILLVSDIMKKVLNNQQKG